MATFEDLEFTEVEVAETVAAQMASESATAPEAIGEAMGKTFAKLGAFIQEQGLTPAGPPRAIYTDYSAEGVKFTVVLPIAEAPATAPTEGEGGFVGTLAGTKTMRFTHHGPYPDLMATYGRITEFLKAEGLIQTEADWVRYMPMWEEYVNDPESTPETELLTYIYLPVT